MEDFYLRFQDEYNALDSLSFFGTGEMEYYDTIENDDEEKVDRQVPKLKKFTHEYAIDFIGVIYDDKDENNILPLEGYHVNIRSLNDNTSNLIRNSLKDYIIDPKTPKRIWA